MAWALENEITKGMTMDLFAPDSTCTRGQIVTFLWRFKGRPAAGNANTPFVDLKAGGFYLDAVAWAVENGITNGTSKTEFSPDSPCTRAQVVTFLYRTPQPSAEPIELIDWVGIFMPTDELTRWKRDGYKVKEQLLTRGYNAALFFASNSAATPAPYTPRSSPKMRKDAVRHASSPAMPSSFSNSALSSRTCLRT